MDIQDVFNRQFDRVYRVAMLYFKNTADAEDAAQTVFLKYVKKPVQFNGPEHEKAWFITATRNCCRDMLRGFWRSRVELSEPPEQAAPNADNSVLKALMSLPQKQREVMYMYYYEGYTAREISKILNRNESTVQSQLASGRQRLKKLIEEDYNE